MNIATFSNPTEGVQKPYTRTRIGLWDGRKDAMAKINRKYDNAHFDCFCKMIYLLCACATCRKWEQYLNTQQLLQRLVNVLYVLADRILLASGMLTNAVLGVFSCIQKPFANIENTRKSGRKKITNKTNLRRLDRTWASDRENISYTHTHTHSQYSINQICECEPQMQEHLSNVSFSFFALYFWAYFRISFLPLKMFSANILSPVINLE